MKINNYTFCGSRTSKDDCSKWYSNNKYANKIRIIILWNISDKYLYKLDDNILKNYKHANKLYACNNDITNIYHVIKLEDLNVSILCWISKRNNKFK